MTGWQLLLKERHVAFSLFFHSVELWLIHHLSADLKRGFSDSHMSHKFVGKITVKGSRGGGGGAGTSLMCMGCRTLHSVLLGDLFQKLEPVPTWWVEHGIWEQWEHKNFAVACSQFCPQEAKGERRKFAPARHSWLWTHNMHTSDIYRVVSSPWGLSHTHPQLLLKLLSHFSCLPPPLDSVGAATLVMPTFSSKQLVF